MLPAGHRIAVVGMAQVTGTVSTNAAIALPAFQRGLNIEAAATLIEDEKLRTAIEAFVAHFYETSLRAKLLTLVTVLEVLAPITEKHEAAQTLIHKWKDEIEHARSQTGDPDAQHALDSLNRELQFRRETSIRQRIRALVRQELQAMDLQERQQLERAAVAAYDARGRLVHEGTLSPDLLNGSYEQAARVVRAILFTRLGLQDT